jgi:photosystem II stability/assembly factor-like uncharacterized protein
MRTILLAALLTLSTTTARAQFILQDSHTTASLRGIHSLGNGVAWASGTEGTILRTTDQGATWRRCATPPDAEKLYFRGIQAFDQNTAIVMSSGKGDLSRLYKTTDGCETWKLVFTNPDPDGFWGAIQFQFHDGPSPNYRYFNGGVLVGDPVGGRFTIFKSNDYGNNWKPLGQDEKYQSIPPALARTGESLFAASNTSVTATADDDAFALVTGGKGGARLVFPEWHGWGWGYDDFHGRYTFSDIKLPIPSSETSGAFSVASRRTSSDRNRMDLMVVGGDYKNPQVGTALFVRHSVPYYEKLFAPRVVVSATPPHGYRSSVAYDATTKTWITVGPNGTDISRDDGRNWTALKPTAQDAADADKNWNALSLPFVVGPKGRIGKLRPEALKP